MLHLNVKHQKRMEVNQEYYKRTILPEVMIFVTNQSLVGRRIVITEKHSTNRIITVLNY